MIRAASPGLKRQPAAGEPVSGGGHGPLRRPAGRRTVQGGLNPLAGIGKEGSAPTRPQIRALVFAVKKAALLPKAHRVLGPYDSDGSGKLPQLR